MIEQKQELIQPILIPIVNGWSAHGDGWAVHGRTQEEAVKNFYEAEQRRREILALSRWSKQVEVTSE